MGIGGTHPGSFCKSGKCRTCAIRNLEEHTEDGRCGRAMRVSRPLLPHVFVKNGDDRVYGVGVGKRYDRKGVRRESREGRGLELDKHGRE
jgi:hypothetical protein